MSPVMSMLNAVNPSVTQLPGRQYVSSLAFSMLNTLNPSSAQPAGSQYVSSWAFSMLNSLNPSLAQPAGSQYVSSLAFSMLNAVSPASGVPVMQYLTSSVVSISNQIPGPMSSLVAGGSVIRDVSTIAKEFVDTDGDGLSDEDELRLGTNPFNRDTDFDGYPDGLEIALGSNPLDANSTPNVNPPGFVLSPAISIFNAAPVVADRRRGSQPNNQLRSPVDSRPRQRVGAAASRTTLPGAQPGAPPSAVGGGGRE
jgi:hypothetical protein